LLPRRLEGRKFNSLSDELKISRARGELELKPQRSPNARSKSKTSEKPETNGDKCQRMLATEAAARRCNCTIRITKDRAPTAGMASFKY